MSVTTITFAIIAVILVSIVAIYFVQSRERARVEEIRKLNMFRERHRHLQQLLHELPPQYMSNELRIMILERSVEALNGIAKIKNDGKVAAGIKQDQDMLKHVREKNPKFKPVPIKTEAQALQMRKLLDVLSKFILTQQKRKQLDAVSAKKYMDQIAFAGAQSRADQFVARAEASKSTKPRVAIHNYHNAIQAFKEIPNHPQAVQAINQYRANIKALEEVADEHNRKLKEEAQKKLDSSDEWNSYLNEEDDEWKKKNAYDD